MEHSLNPSSSQNLNPHISCFQQSSISLDKHDHKKINGIFGVVPKKTSNTKPQHLDICILAQVLFYRYILVRTDARQLQTSDEDDNYSKKRTVKLHHDFPQK